MRKLFLLITVLAFAVMANATIPELTKSTPLTLTAATEGFSQSANANALDGEWINWPDGTIHQGYAKWSVNVVNDGIYNVTVDVQCDNTAEYEVSIIKPLTGDTVDSNRSANDWAVTSETLSCGSLNMVGLTAGEYEIRITEVVQWSHAKVRGVTLTYGGCSTISIPANSLTGPDACLGKTGSKDMVRTAEGYLKSHDNSDPTSEYAYWHIHATRVGYMRVTTNIELDPERVAQSKSPSGHQYHVELHSKLDSAAISTAYEADAYTTGAIALPVTLKIPAVGDYYIKLVNHKQYSSSILSSISFAYDGGEVIAISPSVNTTLPIVDAYHSSCTRSADSIGFPSSSTSSAWIKWNTSTSDASFYNVTLNFSSTNAHGLTVGFYENEDDAPVASLTEGTWVNTKGAGLTLSGRVYLAGGKKLVVKVTNATSGSVAKIGSVVLEPVPTPVTTLPTSTTPVVFNLTDAILSPKAHVTDGMLYFAPIGDTNPAGQWAMFKINANAARTYLFTLSVTSTNEQKYRITILDNEDNIMTLSDKSPSSGAQTLFHYCYLPAGTYFIKLENTREWSNGHVISLNAIVPDDLLELREDITTNEIIETYKDGLTHNIQTIRTIKGGMLNPICLPFSVSSSKVKEVFGADVELYTLGSAELDETGFILNINLNTASDIHHGTPQLIKTSRDIVNPVFTEVEVKDLVANATSGTNANFIGTFVQMDLEANPNILYVGANNNLYYPTETVVLKGQRAYFLVHDTPSGAPIRGARIVSQEDVATDIEFVSSDENQTSKNVQKILQNGQIFIIRDGVRYNVMGVRIQ